MIMLKKTHENILGKLVESHNKEIESKDDIIKALNEQIIENEENHNKINQKLRGNIESLESIIKLKDKELNEINEKVLNLQHKIGGLTTQSKRAIELKDENKELEDKNKELKRLLDIAEKEITEYVKPTSVETRYSVMKVEKGKLIDNERKAKKEKLKNAAKKINERKAELKRKEYEKRLDKALETPVEMTRVEKNKYIVTEQN